MDSSLLGQKKGIFQRIGSRMDDSIWNVFTGLSSIIFCVVGIFIALSDVVNNIKAADGFKDTSLVILTNGWTYLLIAGAFLSILGPIGNAREISRYKKFISQLSTEKDDLTKANSSLDIKVNDASLELVNTKSTIRKLSLDSIEIWLKVYFKQLELTYNERISLYYEDDGILHLLSRYSINPKLKEIHKQKFPLDKGVISEAWQKGMCYKVIPQSYESDSVLYTQHCCNEFGYKEDEINSLTMKSQMYFAKAIKDADDHIGIIIFESYEENLFNDDKIKKVNDFLESSSSLLTNLIEASKKFDQEMMSKKPLGATMTDEEELIAQSGKGA